MNHDDARVRQHLSPVWREKANFIIRAAIPESDWHEQLWARQMDDTTFEICCIPFFLYDVALGDIVRTSSAFEFEEVLASSGRGTFRIHFPEEALDNREAVVRRLADIGALLEWSSASLLAVDTPAKGAQAVVDFMEEGAARSLFIYENGWLSTGDSSHGKL